MKTGGRGRGHLIDLLFTLSLFCLFTAAAFIVVIIGSNVYKSTAAHMEENYSTRTALSYVTEKIRQHDRSGGVSLVETDPGNMLILTDMLDEGTYRTYIYSCDGYLCELVIRDGTEFSKELGEKIIKVDSFSITDRGGGFLELAAKDKKSSTVSCLLHLRSRQP